MASEQVTPDCHVLEADQSKNNNTLTNVDDLVQSLPMQGDPVYYRFDAELYLTTSSALGLQGVKFAAVAPVTPYIRYSVKIDNLLGSLINIGQDGFDASGGTLSVAVLTSGKYLVKINGVVASNGDESSDLKIQFAQNSTDGSNPVTIQKGSSMVVHKLPFFS